MPDLSFPMWIPGNQAGPSAAFASNFGVTGLPSSTRDDSPLLRNAYTAAVAAGLKTLILPSGFVYIRSYSADAVYPFSYAVRVEADDFTVVVPPGCTIICTVVDDGQGGTNAANYWSIFQFTGSNSGIKGGGYFVHSVPGYTGATPNNYVACVHLTSPSDYCYADNLKAYGFVPVIGVFDNSSSFYGGLNLLSVRTCQYGVIQSSAQTTTRGYLTNCTVVDYKTVGFGTQGRRQELGTLKAEDRTGFSATTAAALYIGGLGQGINVSGFQATGPNTSHVGATTRAGITIAPTVFTVAQPINITGYSLDGFDQALSFTGATNIQRLNGGAIKNCNFVINKSPNGANHCANTYFNGLTADVVEYGFVQNFTAGAVSENTFYLEDVELSGVVTNAYLTTGSVIPTGTVLPVVPLANRADVQRVASAASVVATSGIDNLSTILTGTTNTTLTTPATPVDGQRWNIKLEGAQTLAFTGTVAGGNPGAVAAGYTRNLIFDATAATWT
jgi:hypothetical protein